jgi:hypothetical protein
MNMEIAGIETDALVEETLRRRSTRRAAMMLGGGALASLALSRGAQAQTTLTDADMLNFALNLEYLEAQYYTLAYSGVTIDQMGVAITGPGGTPGGAITVKSNPTVPFVSTTLKAFASHIAAEEQIHVTFLRSALGAAAVGQPPIDLLNSFNVLAAAAGLGSTFDPFASELNFLLGAFVFEDVGVSAYYGAIGQLTSAANLNAAIGLMSTEGYHSATIRNRIYALGTAAQQAATAISATREKLDGTGNDDVGLGLTSTGASTVICANSNGIPFSRTAAEVLSIVYGGGSGKGAFFPSGLNGTVK